MFRSPSWLAVLVPTRMFFLLVVVCSWMRYMWILVSAALFSEWPHGYSPGQSIFAELGYSFRTAASCLLPGLISISGSGFCFLFSSTFFARIGQNQRAGTMPQLNSSVAMLLLRAIPLLSISSKKSGVRFPPIHLTNTTLDQLPLFTETMERNVLLILLHIESWGSRCFLLSVSALFPCY